MIHTIIAVFADQRLISFENEGGYTPAAEMPNIVTILNITEVPGGYRVGCVLDWTADALLDEWAWYEG